MTDALNRTFRVLPLLVVLALAALSYHRHWSDRLLGSHMFRQTHTAQNAEMYLLVGWNPLRSYARFQHKPGVNVLEFPFYQSLDAGLSRLAGISIDHAGRLLNMFFGMLLAAGLLVFWHGLPGSCETSRADRLGLAGLVLSLPLLFAISQWVLADLCACAMAVWALVFFGMRAPVAVAAHFLLLALSFAIKPTVFVATLPFYALILPRAGWMRLIATAAALLSGLTWFWYGQRTNVHFGGQYKVTDAGYYVGHFALSLRWLGKLAMRLVFYVLGPGTLLLLAMGGRTLRALRSPLGIACGASFLVYLLAFLNLNVRHNYYQLPLLIPVSFALLTGIGATATRWRWPLLGTVAVAMNVGLAERNLLFIDRDLNAAIDGLRGRVTRGIEKPELAAFTDVEAAGQVFAYYLERYVITMPPGAIEEHAPSAEWFGACDRALGNDCERRIQAAAPACAQRGQAFGRYWVCAS